MNGAAEPASAVRRTGYIRSVGSAVLVVLALLMYFSAPWADRMQAAWFDAYQSIKPRTVVSMPVTIVEIDDETQERVRSQWPWPRDLLAELVGKIGAQEPAAIALDVLMPEEDRQSPDKILQQVQKLDPPPKGALATLPSNDEKLAKALTQASAVLAVAGIEKASTTSLKPVPIGVRDRRPRPDADIATDSKLTRYIGVMGSYKVLNDAASGAGLVSVVPAGGVVRRVPLAANINGTLVPALAIEMLRVAKGKAGEPSALRLNVAGANVENIAVGDFLIPTDEDGAVRLYYSRHRDERFISANRVFDGTADPASLKDKLVLIGVAGKGVVDDHNTPLGESMTGTEIHAQLLENLFDGTLLHRPRWAPWLELTVFVALGALLIWATPIWRPQAAALLALACAIVPVGLAFAAFGFERMLFDALIPALNLLLLFGVLLVLTLAEATRQRRSLERIVTKQREQGARLAGEFEAAQRVQTGSLPRADLLKGDRRIDLAATMIPAREVGGDLYDFFRLDDHRLFLLVGDVAGKGLSASIFMAVSKALYKSTMLRAPHTDIGELMRIANAEVSRDNPEALFVTAFAAILDLDTGTLAYCNAGHPNPYLAGPSDNAIRQIADGDGPPLCAVADFPYASAHLKLRVGELLCLISDGVTEAQNEAGELYGGARAQQLLAAVGTRATAAGAIVEALRSDVEVFAAGIESADDITILALRWNGPSAGVSAR